MVYCTTCAAKKNTDKGLVAAIDRYDSVRIREVHQKSVRDGAEFLIFSGVYGLLKASDSIPYYDHALKLDEVAAMTLKLSEQLKTFAGKQVYFFTTSKENDPGIEPYLMSLEAASQQAKMELIIHFDYAAD